MEQGFSPPIFRVIPRLPLFLFVQGFVPSTDRSRDQIQPVLLYRNKQETLPARKADVVVARLLCRRIQAQGLAPV